MRNYKEMLQDLVVNNFPKGVEEADELQKSLIETVVALVYSSEKGHAKSHLAPELAQAIYAICGMADPTTKPGSISHSEFMDNLVQATGDYFCRQRRTPNDEEAVKAAVMDLVQATTIYYTTNYMTPFVALLQARGKEEMADSVSRNAIQAVREGLFQSMVVWNEALKTLPKGNAACS